MKRGRMYEAFIFGIIVLITGLMCISQWGCMKNVVVNRCPKPHVHVKR